MEYIQVTDAAWRIDFVWDKNTFLPFVKISNDHVLITYEIIFVIHLPGYLLVHRSSIIVVYLLKIFYLAQEFFKINTFDT